MTWPRSPTVLSTALILARRSGSLKPRASSMTTGTVSSLATNAARPAAPGFPAPRPRRTGTRRDGASFSVRVWMVSSVSTSTSKLGEDLPTNRSSSVRVRLDVALASVVTVADHCAAQQLGGLSPPPDAGVCSACARSSSARASSSRPCRPSVPMTRKLGGQGVQLKLGVVAFGADRARLPRRRRVRPRPRPARRLHIVR